MEGDFAVAGLPYRSSAKLQMRSRRSIDSFFDGDDKMKRQSTRIMYVECCASEDHRGRARICRVRFSKTGRTIYLGGLVLQSLRGSGIFGNYVNTKTGIEYWVSGPKKNGEDRHWAGGGEVHIDSDVVDEYWRDIRECDPPENPFIA